MPKTTPISKPKALGVRDRNGRFTVGNPGGPGRPNRNSDTRRYFLDTMKRMVEHPERFTDRQRDALVELLTSFMERPSDEEAIAAASVLVSMNELDLRASRCVR